VPFVEAIVPEVQLEDGWYLLNPPPEIMELKANQSSGKGTIRI
jgi:hypothetical protein